MAVNYQQKILTENTQNFKKHYEDSTYVVFHDQTFSLKLGSVRNPFKFFIKQKAEQFGDPVAAYGSTLQPILRIYDSSGGIVLNTNTCTLVDSNLGEWKYDFNVMDFNKKGVFDGEVLNIIAPVSGIGGSESLIGKFKINVY